MKFSSIRYLLREGFRNIWFNRFMAVASICVLVSCLLLTGAAYLTFVNIDRAFDWVYGQNVAVAFADLNVTEEQALTIRDHIAGIANVASVDYISKDELLEKYKDDLPAATYENMREDNPLQYTYVVAFRDMGQFDATLAQIKQVSGVESVSSQEGLASMLTNVRQTVFLIGGWIIVMLLLVSLFIIANTIKLTVYSRRLEISIMKSVGATNTFVRVPFVIEGMVLGLVAGGLAYGLIYAVYDRVAGLFTSDVLVSLVDFSAVWVVVLVGFLTIGLLTGALGSAISMRKYLKDEGGLSGVL